MCYVDDGTYSVGHTDPATLSGTLSSQYRKISEYMVANKLVINDDKTHLLVLGTKKTAAQRATVSLQAGNHTINPSKTETLLGCQISDDLKWREHILNSDQSSIRQLTSRVNGLSLVSSRADFKTKLMVANGIVISKICYLIQLWGGCEGYLIHSLQVIMNRAARLVTGMSGFTSTRRLMESCGWMSVKQLVVYQTLVMIHKILLTGSPSHLYEKLSRSHPFRTRQASTRCIRQDETFSSNSSLLSSSFRFRGATYYNQLPASLRAVKTMGTFKTKVKHWVKGNIDLG